MVATGLELLQESPRKCRFCGQSDVKYDAFSDADADDDGPGGPDGDPDLAALVKAWEWLTDDERRLVMLAAGVGLRDAVDVR